MRGYGSLKESDDLELLYRILTKISHLKPRGTVSELIANQSPGSEIEMYQLQQFLLQHFSSSDFKKQVLAHIGSGKSSYCYAMPKEMLSILSDEGIAVAGIRSLFLWYLFCIKSWVKGIAYALLVIAKSLSGKMKLLSIGGSRGQQENSYIILPGIPGNAVPDSDLQDCRCLISWFVDNYLRKKKAAGQLPLSEVQEIRHNVTSKPNLSYGNFTVRAMEGVLPVPLTSAAIGKFLVLVLYVSVKALIYLLAGRWQAALQMVEIVKSLQASVLVANQLPVAVFFNNSCRIYKPLWAYTLEKRGTQVSFYFYSTNNELLDGKLNYGWDIVTWGHYLVWDQYQVDFLSKYSPIPVTTEVVGPVYLEDTASACPDFMEDVIAVFDVQPVRFSFYAQLGMNSEYYVPAVTNSFLTDISRQASSCGMKVVLKRKRDIGKMLHPKYRNLIDELSRSGVVREVDAGLSPYKILEKAKGVICMPFTSVAHYASELGVPAIYYDPTALLNPDRRDLSHGIPILNNDTDLLHWMADL